MEEFVPPLAAGETGPILQRHLIATAGPWQMTKPEQGLGHFICPATNLSNPICYVYDSVAENAAFFANAWEDQKRLIATVLRYKVIFSELAKGLRQNNTNPDTNKTGVFIVPVAEDLVKMIEELGKI
jgi:hypothetical protein